MHDSSAQYNATETVRSLLPMGRTSAIVFAIFVAMVGGCSRAKKVDIEASGVADLDRKQSLIACRWKVGTLGALFRVHQKETVEALPEDVRTRLLNDLDLLEVTCFGDVAAVEGAERFFPDMSLPRVELSTAKDFDLPPTAITKRIILKPSGPIIAHIGPAERVKGKQFFLYVDWSLQPNLRIPMISERGVTGGGSWKWDARLNLSASDGIPVD